MSKDRLRGIRIFDITDIANPKYIANVQTCRGSHTHTVVVDPKDPDNVYVYISGSAGVRSPSELPAAPTLTPDKDPNSALFRIEVIKVPLAHPEQAAIVSSPRIFNDLAAPPAHGEAPEDIAAIRQGGRRGPRRAAASRPRFSGQEIVLPAAVRQVRCSTASSRPAAAPARRPAPTAPRCARRLPAIIAKLVGRCPGTAPSVPARPSATTSRSIPAIGLAGGACDGYGLLLDISDPANPMRIGAVADSNFSYWHSATFNNDGTKLLFSDEWGGGGAPKCRATDKKEWGADAIFTIVERQDDVPELLQDAGGADRRRRTAWRTTAR